MSYAQRMIETNPSNAALAEYIEARFDCAQACRCESTCNNLLSAMGA